MKHLIDTEANIAIASSIIRHPATTTIKTLDNIHTDRIQYIVSRIKFLLLIYSKTNKYPKLFGILSP